ncbi:MAG: site-specific integrase [Piscinibacter sp.]
MLFSEVSKAFIHAYEGRDPTLAGRMDWWTSHLGTTEFSAVTSEQVESALDALAQRGAMRNVRGRGLQPTGRPIAPATLNRYRAALGSLFKWAKARRLTPRGWVSPLRDVPTQREGEGALVYLTAEQMEKVLAAARLMVWKKLPALLLLAFTTGLRRGSIEALRWRDVDLSRRRITIARTKNGRPHVAHLTERVAQEMERMPGPRDADLLVFGSTKGDDRPHNFNHSWTRVQEIAGLPRVKFHALRHSCASHAAAHGASQVMLMDLLGHRSLRMVQRYAHLGIDDRAAFVDKVFASTASGG